jgi:DHA1 family inner membrane transport protein
MESKRSRISGSRTGQWIALALCAAVLVAGVLEQLVRNRPTYAEIFAPNWIPFAAAVLAAAGIMRLNGRLRWLRVQRALRWSGLLLMLWAANGLPLDVLRLTPLMPPGVDWPRLATKTLALAAAVVLARLALTRQAAPASARAATWYGYAAFVPALPYPALRTSWALGGTLGLMWPGAAGHGWAPWLACVPWLLAAALSLLLVPTWRWMPRRLLLAAGWFATAVVALMGPAACWSLVTKLVVAGDLGLREHGIAAWVPGLFYGSWLLWAIAAGAATRSYQLRSAALRMSSPT